MTPVGKDAASRRGIPHLYHLNAVGGETCAIGRPRQRVHYRSIAAIGEERASCGRLPHLHRSIMARGGETCAIGRPGDGVHAICMAMKGEDWLACGRLPHLHRLIAAAGGEACSIGRPRDGVDIMRMPPIGAEDGSSNWCTFGRRRHFHGGGEWEQLWRTWEWVLPDRLRGLASLLQFLRKCLHTGKALSRVLGKGLENERLHIR